uniref:Mitoferrin n=1 Tax=Timema shepardi TaxID=629360 RepID=A0A7R9B249_TIMSH|nr:unnamed protein product [Timema shepardi]
MDFDDYEKLPTSNVTTYMTAGAVAGVMEHCVMYPLDSVKTQMQNLSPSSNAAYRGIGETLVRMVRQEGVFRPVRGMSAVVVGAAPAHALYFACYEQIKDFITQTTKFTNVVPNYGMADSIVAAGTVLPNPAGNSLPGPSQGRNIEKRRKLVRPSSPLIEKIREVVRPQPRFLVMSRVESNEDLKRVAHETPCGSPKYYVNCKGPHSAWYRACPKWKVEKKVLKIQSEKISYAQARKEYVSSQAPVFQTIYSQIVSQNVNCPNCHCAVNLAKTSSRPVPLVSSRDIDNDSAPTSVVPKFFNEVKPPQRGRDEWRNSEAVKASPTGALKKDQRETAEKNNIKKALKALTKPSRKDTTTQSLQNKPKPLLKREVQERLGKSRGPKKDLNKFLFLKG